MVDFNLIHLPQSSPNDITAVIAEWSKARDQWVHKGEVVAVAETTKSVFDVEAPAAGYLVELVATGAEAAVGQVIAVLTPTPVTEAEVRTWLANRQAATVPSPASAKAPTIKAQLLAQRHNIDLTAVPTTGDRVTEADVQAYLAAQPKAAGRARPPAPVFADLVDDRFPVNHIQRILIIGGGNGATQIIDALAKLPDQRAVAILDDNPAIHGKKVAGVPVLGAVDMARAVDLRAAGEVDAAIISISTSIAARSRIFEAWKAHGIPFANVIHPSSVVGMNVRWGEGNVVMALCHVGACATVGDNNFLSAYCSIEHHCMLGNHCSFGPSVVTSSRVHIGDRVRFGTGIFIEPGVTIGADSVVASGLAIWQNIPARSLLKAKLGYTIRPR